MSTRGRNAPQFLSSLGAVTNAVADRLPGRSVDFQPVSPIGWYRHEQGVRRLQDSFSEIPRGARVRLAKKTSNLFRGRESTTPGLDVSGLGGVIAIDPVARTADVQGMCTYEDLVDATLPFGLAPLVVPQLKTITLGGAVTGMGVESTSFRNGLPHESLLEMDVLTGTGDIVTCSRDENVDLFRAFPNSYGSLGYAVRLTIELEPVPDTIELREVRYDDLKDFQEALAQTAETGKLEGDSLHGLDAVSFSPAESYIIAALPAEGNNYPATSDYTRDAIFYRSIQHPRGTKHDLLSIRDYIWRWDTDWFWCSRAFGAQNPNVRPVWPRQWRRSSFYWKIVRLDRKYSLEYNFLKKPHGLPATERVVQDIEITADKTAEWLEWFFQASDIQPVWLCPIRLRDGVEDLSRTGEILRDADEPWPLYPLQAGTTWINAGFWSGVPADHVSADVEPGAFNRVIEAKVNELGGHKSLYSEAFYSPEHFRSLYGGDYPDQMKKAYDPDGRFPTLFEKTVGNA